MNKEEILALALEVGFMVSTQYGSSRSQPMPVSDSSTLIKFAERILESERFQENLKILRKALENIVNLHEKGLEEIEKETGFLGWTCCGQLQEIAKKALERTKEK